MPYYVFEIEPSKRFTLLDTHESYRAARSEVRDRRRALASGSERTVRMIFAANPEQGQALLAEKREPRPLGDE